MPKGRYRGFERAGNRGMTLKKASAVHDDWRERGGRAYRIVGVSGMPTHAILRQEEVNLEWQQASNIIFFLFVYGILFVCLLFETI